MTPSSCVDSCKASGYKYAGLEYGRQVSLSLVDTKMTLIISATAATPSTRLERLLLDAHPHVLEIPNRHVVAHID
jgi:hypothetical protein